MVPCPMSSELPVAGWLARWLPLNREIDDVLLTDQDGQRDVGEYEIGQRIQCNAIGR